MPRKTLRSAWVLALFGPWLALHAAAAAETTVAEPNAAAAKPAAQPAAQPAASLLMIDDDQAEASDGWKVSSRIRPYVGSGYRTASGPTSETLRYAFQIPQDGAYSLVVSYSASSNRARNVSYRFATRDGQQTATVDQRKPTNLPGGMHLLGEFPLAAGPFMLTIDTQGAEGAVIADAVFVLTAAQLESARKTPLAGSGQAGSGQAGPAQVGAPAAALAAASPAKPAAPKVKPPAPPANEKDKKPTLVVEQAPAWTPPSPRPTLARISPDQIDQRLEQAIGGVMSAELAGDEQFLRRVTLDILGRQPTPAEVEALVAARSPVKRALVVERLLADPEFGANWADYWSDVVSFRVPDPELTFLNYRPFKTWMAAELNRGASWDEIVYQILTASGKVGANPAATFIGFHQAEKSRLTAETSRIFLGVNIQCAECHDHPFIDMPQATFHSFAAYFVRSSAKMPQNDSGAVDVASKTAGEHKVPGKKDELRPVAFDAEPLALGASDIERRTRLAQWLTSPDNPWFAKAYVNRVWARLIGAGFCEPVDDIGEGATPSLPELHAALAEHFIASGYQPRELIRVIVESRAYQRSLTRRTEAPVAKAKDDPPAADGELAPEKPFAAALPTKLRGDEIFASLSTAIELPNFTPPASKPNGAIRFPPPPKSTRDLVNDAFGFDPSLPRDFTAYTMRQAMFMMNNAQIQSQLVADPKAPTMLARLLADESNDTAAVQKLYSRVLARPARPGELKIALDHLAELKDRAAAFEDLLWSLVNSTEFTSR